jgi:hypothetical protein
VSHTTEWNDNGRRPSFTNPDAICAEPNGWYRNKGHRRRPGVVRGRQPRTSDGRTNICTSWMPETIGDKLAPFNDYVTAYVAGHITDGELAYQADRYGALGIKVKGR